MKTIIDSLHGSGINFDVYSNVRIEPTDKRYLQSDTDTTASATTITTCYYCYCYRYQHYHNGSFPLVTVSQKKRPTLFLG